MTNAVVLTSGGMDSAICLWQACMHNDRVLALHFSYAQKNAVKEFAAVTQLCIAANQAFIQPVGLETKVTLAPLAVPIFGKSSAILQGGHGKMDKVEDLIVPGRNAIFLAIAYAFAEQRGCRRVYIGAKQSQFPDCQPAFLQRVAIALNMGLGYSTIGNEGVHLETPLMGMNRKEAYALGLSIKCPVELSWSCYENGAVPCGKCGACIDRAKAFE